MKGKLKMDPKELSQLWKDATEKIDYKNLEEQGIIKKSKKKDCWDLLDGSRLPDAVMTQMVEPEFERETGILKRFKVIKIPNR